MSESQRDGARFHPRFHTVLLSVQRKCSRELERIDAQVVVQNDQVVSIDPRREKLEFALSRQTGSRPPLSGVTIDFTHGVWSTGPGLQ